VSLWHCAEHGLVGPNPCCKGASLVTPETIKAAEEALKRTAPPAEEWVPGVASAVSKLTD